MSKKNLEKISFKKAKKQEKIRQSFLDLFFKKHPSKNISKIIYNQRRTILPKYVDTMSNKGEINEEEAESFKEHNREMNFLAFILLATDTAGKKKKFPIFVNPRSFKELSEVEFTYNLLDHEYFHAADFHHGITVSKDITLDHTNLGILQPEIIIAIADIRAFFNQLEQIKKRKISNRDYFNNLVNGVLKYHEILTTTAPQNEFETEVVQAQLSNYQHIFSTLKKTLPFQIR
jgi:hypothetical protein